MLVTLIWDALNSTTMEKECWLEKFVLCTHLPVSPIMGSNFTSESMMDNLATKRFLGALLLHVMIVHGLAEQKLIFIYK